MWYLQESNQGHTDFQSVALPTELRYLLNKAAANIISKIGFTNKNLKIMISFLQQIVSNHSDKNAVYHLYAIFYQL